MMNRDAELLTEANLTYRTKNTHPKVNTRFGFTVFFWCGLGIVGISLQSRQNGRDSVSNHQPNDCLLNRLFRRRSKKTSKLRVTGLRVGNSPVTGEFPAQMASNAENGSICWRHHDCISLTCDGAYLDINSPVNRKQNINLVGYYRNKVTETLKEIMTKPHLF